MCRDSDQQLPELAPARSGRSGREQFSDKPSRRDGGAAEATTGQHDGLTGTGLLAEQVVPLDNPTGYPTGRGLTRGRVLRCRALLPGGWLATASALSDRPTREPRRSLAEGLPGGRPTRPRAPSGLYL